MHSSFSWIVARISHADASNESPTLIHLKKWLFLFNCEILHMNHSHRSASQTLQSFDPPPPIRIGSDFGRGVFPFKKIEIFAYESLPPVRASNALELRPAPPTVAPVQTLVMEFLNIFIYWMLGGEGRSGGHRRSNPEAFASRCFPCPQRSCSAEPGRRCRTLHCRWPVCRSRLLTALSISPAATLTLKAGLCLGCIPR
jgi:hypothetical protein